MICPKCSHWVSPPNKICPNCGYDAAPSPRQNPAPPQPQPATPDPFGLPNSPVPPAYPTSPAPQPVELQQPASSSISPRTWFVLGGVVLACIVGLYFLRLVLGFATAHPYITFFLSVFVIIVALATLASRVQPERCYVCNNSLTGSRYNYNWNLDGASRRICSHCRQSLQRKNSSEAMRQRNQR